MAGLLYVVTHPMTARLLLRGQLAHMRRRGFTVTLVASPSPELAAVAAQEGVDVRGVPMERRLSPVGDLLALVRLYRLMRRLRPAIVNAGTPKAGLLGMLAAWLARVPVRIYTLRGLRLETTAGPLRGLLLAAERVASGCAHRILCVSHSLRRCYVELGLAAGGKTRVLGAGSSNGVDLERFRQRPDESARVAVLRSELGIPAESPVVGFVGRLTRDKGVEDLRVVFEIVHQRLPHSRLLLIGGFERDDAVPKRVEQWLRRHPAVVHPGAVGEASGYYPLMDVLLLPSYREGLPNAPLEAAAAAIPVAGYRVTGTVDAVADGTTGTLVEAGDEPALARAVLRYLEDPALRRDHGRAGRERVAALFRAEAVWRALEQEYLDLLRQQGLLPDGPSARRSPSDIQR